MKRTGRPRLDASSSDPSASVHLKLAARDYDDVDKVAKARRESIQDTIRRGIKRLLTDERGARL